MAGLFRTIGGIFAPKPPTPPKPLPMPDLNDPQIVAQKQLEAQKASARSGRASTVLSTSDYSGTLLS